MAQIPTTNLDAGTDSPANARADLLACVQRVNGLEIDANGSGADLVAGTIRTVSTIAALRAVASTGRSRVMVAGYYAPGDGGGGLYWLDTSDTTSADNGISVIVGSDASRWKLITGDCGPTLGVTEGVTFANGYRFAASGHLTVPTNNSGNVRYWGANYSVNIPSGATIPAGDVRHDHIGLGGRARSQSVNSRIWGVVGLAHVDSPATSNAQIGQALGAEFDVNNATGYDVANLDGEGDVGGVLVATGGSNALKFGYAISKIGTSGGRFYVGLYMREDCLHPSGFGIYFGNVSPSVGIRFGDNYTGGAAMQTNPGQDALYMRTTSGPYARVRSELDRLVMNCGNGGMYVANAANTENLLIMSNAGALGTKVSLQALAAPTKASAATTIDASASSVILCNDSGATTVTAISNGVDMQELTLVALSGNTTIQNNASIRLRAGTNYVIGAGTTITFLSIGGTWYEK